MATVNWKKWSDTWSALFPKSQNWSKIRDDTHDVNGEPLHRFQSTVNLQSVSPAFAGVLAEHRLTVPGTTGGRQVCFAGDYTGSDHASHLEEVVTVYQDWPPVLVGDDPDDGTVASVYSFEFELTDGTADSWELSGALPDGLTFAAGVISGTPTEDGDFPLTVTVTDIVGRSDSFETQLTIDPEV